MRNLWIPAFLFFLCACEGTASTKKASTSNLTPSAKDDCDDPDADIQCCFRNMPTTISNVMHIAGTREPGERMIISGTVYKGDTQIPHAGLLLYAYHTDAKGYYAKAGKETGIQKWHGRLHGWCRTDANGTYRISTIRPARYPDNSMPAHIHMAIKKPETGKAIYITDVVFRDDSLVNKAYAHSIRTMQGGSGIVTLLKAPNGTWKGERDIRIIL